MNKNDILMIARSLYLQQSISRQLFAKFDPNKQLDFLDGSFNGAPAKLVDKFNVFIGSNDNVNKNGKILQFIKKDGQKFTVYGLTKDSQVNFNYSHSITGWNRLALYLSSISAQIVVGSNSFHSKLKNLWALLNTQIYNKYENKAQFENTYVELSAKFKGQQLQQQLTKKKVKYIIDAWINQLILMLDNIQNQLSKMHLFSLSNSIDSIPVYITQLRQIIADKSFEYINKNIKTNDAEKSVKLIQEWLLNNTIIRQIQNSARADLQTQNNVKNVTEKISNVWQRVYEIHQFVIMFKKHSDMNIVRGLLNAVNESNTSYQLSQRLNELQIYNNGSKLVEKLKQDYDVDVEDGVQLLKTYINNKGRQEKYLNQYKKAKIQLFVDFLYGDNNKILFSTWKSIYELLSNILQSQPQYIQLFDKFNNVVEVLKDQELFQLRKKLLISSRLVSGVSYRAVGDINRNNAQKVMQETIQKIKNKFVGIVQDGDIIVNNIMQFYSKLNEAVDSVMRKGSDSILYDWVKNTKIMNQMRNFINAIEQ